MLFGYNTQPRTTVVTAAHTVEEFQAWFASLNHEGALYTAARETEMFEHLMNDEWTDLKTTVYVFEFDHDYKQAEFARIHDIVILPRLNAIDRNADMDYLSNGNDFMNETRTIAEINGLDKHDPWDTRSEEEKAEDLIMSERMKELQKQDKISGDSFAPSSKGGVAVTDIHASTNADGTVVIDGVNAVKTTGNEAQEAMEQMARVRDSEHRTARPAVLDEAVIVDLSDPNAVLTVTEAPEDEVQPETQVEETAEPAQEAEAAPAPKAKRTRKAKE